MCKKNKRMVIKHLSVEEKQQLIQLHAYMSEKPTNGKCIICSSKLPSQKKQRICSDDCRREYSRIHARAASAAKYLTPEQMPTVKSANRWKVKKEQIEQALEAKKKHRAKGHCYNCFTKLKGNHSKYCGDKCRMAYHNMLNEIDRLEALIYKHVDEPIFEAQGKQYLLERKKMYEQLKRLLRNVIKNPTTRNKVLYNEMLEKMKV